jgi:hypothetical protein
MSYNYGDEREVHEMPKDIFLAAKALDREAESLGIDPTFELAEAQRDRAKSAGDIERYQHLREVCIAMKTIEFSGANALYLLT